MTTNSLDKPSYFLFQDFASDAEMNMNKMANFSFG